MIRKRQPRMLHNLKGMMKMTSALRDKYLKCAEECMQKAREAAVAGGVFVATKYARDVHNIDISNNIYIFEGR